MLKGKKKLSPEEIHAKKSVVGHIKSAAEDMMKEPLGKLNKVTVAADNPKDLTHGLDKAKELMAHMPTDMQEGSAEEESKESPEEEAAEMESPEEEATARVWAVLSKAGGDGAVLWESAVGVMVASAEQG